MTSKHQREKVALSRRNPVIEKITAIGLMTLSAFELVASPFDDAKFWFNGGSPSHGDGMAESGDFFDAVHANDSAHVNHTCKFYGHEANRRIEIQNVTFPLSGETKATQVLQLRDMRYQSEGKTWSYPGVLSLHALRDNLVKDGAPSEKFTVILRFRRDGTLPDANKGEWLLQWGYGNKGGFLFGFEGNECNDKGEDVGKYLRCYCWQPGSDGKAAQSQIKFYNDAQLYLPTNVWTDLGISVDGDRLQVVMARAKCIRPSSVATWRPYPVIGLGSVSGCMKTTAFFTGDGSSDAKFSTSCFALGAQAGATFDAPKEVTTADYTPATVSGAYQQLAIWDRALSIEEMLDAFGEARPMIAKVGLGNESSDEFGGIRPSDGKQTIDAEGSCADASSIFVSGDEMTITFNGRANESGLRQIASFKTTMVSGGGRISLNVNAVDCGVCEVFPGKVAKWNVPGRAMISGQNKVLLKRVDNGVGSVEMDCFTLGGSWQVGVLGDGDAYARDSEIVADYQGGADVNPLHWTSMFATYGSSNNIRIRFWSDEVVAKCATSQLTIPMTLHVNGTSETRQGAEHLEMSVNGTVKHDEPANPSAWADKQTKNIELLFAKGELKPGWNELVVKFLPADAANKSTVYVKNDFYRFECGKLSKGLCILIK